MKVTEQVPAADRVHGEPEMLPEPPLVPGFTTKATVPAGVVAPRPAVSATVAVHIEATPTVTVVGQVTPVEVERGVGVTAVDVPELVA